MQESAPNAPLMSRGMKAVLASQFLSAFADNALLFAILAQLKAEFYPEWSHPILQMVFVFTYIILAPFVGQIADRFSKGRVMLFSNIFKFIGALGICLGLNPFLCYGLVGVGAAAYSPAKYGILGELTGGDNLVKANGVMEASTIAAILVGSIVGGKLSDINLMLALGTCAALYVFAVIANFFIPHLVAARPGKGWDIKLLITDFLKACRVLWANQESRFSLIGTSLFWGAGVTLRFLLVAWVPVALGLQDNTTPTILNGMVAVGIVVGAGFAAKFITLKTVYRCIPAGVIMGAMVVLLSLQTNIIPSYIILIILGMFGGLFVVPLNALLQEKGKETVGAGNAVAVQNLGENSAMLIMLGLYSVAIKAGLSVVSAGIGFGAVFAIAITGLWVWDHARKKTR